MNIGRTIQSQVNCSNPNFELYPDFKNVTCEIAEVHAGDMLFIPAFYWHQVTSTELTVSANVFWGDAGTNVYTQKLLDTRREAFFYWVCNIIEQNRPYEKFPAYLTRIETLLFKFFHKQWHDDLSPEQLQEVMAAIKEHLQIDEFPTTSDVPLGKSVNLKIRGLNWRD